MLDENFKRNLFEIVWLEIRSNKICFGLWETARIHNNMKTIRTQQKAPTTTTATSNQQQHH